MKTRIAALLAGGLAGAAVCNVANAAVELSFNQQVFTPASAVMAGAAPWLKVKFEDTATAGTVAVTVSANLVGAQTLTGIWLNLSPSVAAALTSFSVDPLVTVLPGEDPFAFVAINAAPTNTTSGIHTTLQDLGPSGATKAQVGNYNIQLRFPNSGGTFQGVETETFNLVSNASSGLNESAFLQLSSQTGGGLPNPPFYALASFTNVDLNNGVPGSGIGFIASVPEPTTYALIGVGFAMVGMSLRRSRRR